MYVSFLESQKEKKLKVVEILLERQCLQFYKIAGRHQPLDFWRIMPNKGAPGGADGKESACSAYILFNYILVKLWNNKYQNGNYKSSLKIIKEKRFP